MSATRYEEGDQISVLDSRARPEQVGAQDEPAGRGPRRLLPVVLVILLIGGVLLAYLDSKNESPLIEVSPPPAGEQVPDLLPESLKGVVSAHLFASWAEPIARRARIPKRALMAYANAVAIARRSDPDCGIGWTTLAGISSKESSHGEHGNASILPNGDVRPKIRGHALDGTDGTVKMVDAYEPPSPDGKPVYIRAMGPFQFIPETWQRNAVDGNGDGVLDPDNIDDAAATAAHYLCARGGDLRTPRGWRDALRAYNDSTSYLLDARERALAYADGFGY